MSDTTTAAPPSPSPQHRRMWAVETVLKSRGKNNMPGYSGAVISTASDASNIISAAAVLDGWVSSGVIPQ